MNDEPVWGKVFSEALFRDIRSSSPTLVWMSDPTLFSDDGEWVYLSSFDESCRVDDIERLSEMLEELVPKFKRHEEAREHYKAHVAEIDFHVVSELLLKNGEVVNTHLKGLFLP